MTLIRLYRLHRNCGRPILLAARLAWQSIQRDRRLEAQRVDAERRAASPFTNSRAGSL